MRSTILNLFIVGIICFTGCGKSNESAEVADESIETEEPEEVVEIEEDIFVIDEHKINEIPLTVSEPVPTGESDEGEEEDLVSDVDIIDHETFDAHLVALDYEPDTMVEESLAIVPLDETETLIAYNNKEKQKAVLQVVRDGNGDIDHIMFADKNHKDVFDVSAGMSAKDAKRLRKDLKHMKHKGSHYLYDDQSNIMYLLDEVYSDGTEVLEADIDEMEIRAIVWKDKKHEDRVEILD